MLDDGARRSGFCGGSLRGFPRTTWLVQTWPPPPAETYLLWRTLPPLAKARIQSRSFEFKPAEEVEEERELGRSHLEEEA